MSIPESVIEPTQIDELVKRLRAPWTYTEGKREILCSEAAEALERLVSLQRTRRWNIEKDGSDLLICDGAHEKSERCEYKRYVLAVERDSLRAKLDRVTAALRLLRTVSFMASQYRAYDGGPISEPAFGAAISNADAVLPELSDDAPAQERDVGSVTLPGGRGGSSVGQISGSASSGGLSVGVAHGAAQISDEVREAMIDAETALKAITTRLSHTTLKAAQCG